MLVIAVVGIIFYIKPVHQLNLNYKEVDWETKLMNIVQTRETALTLNEEEINNLAKKGIAEQVSASGLAYKIEGADFSLDNNKLAADAIVKWGPVRAEGTAVYQLSYNDGKLLLEPQMVKIRSSDLSPSLFKLKPIEIDPGKYLPELVQVTGVAFGEHDLKIEFTVNWLQLPGLFK